jgi:glucose-6-phosphate isomerase
MISTKAYQDLLSHYQQMKARTLVDLFAEDNARFKHFSLKLDDFIFDFSKNNITEVTLSKLINLAQEMELPKYIQAMFNGEKINNTENRAVLHTALRSHKEDIFIDRQNVMPQINHVLNQMKEFSENLHNGKYLGYTGKTITDIVNIGIGGSDLGPTCVCQALKPYRKNNLNIHFIASIDGYELYDKLANLNPETTLFIIVSKTFTTQETITNANSVRQWFLDKTGNDVDAIKKHFVAVSTNKVLVNQFGIIDANMFQFWDFVGGRYSLWSAVGLSIVLYIGFDNFKELLAGASAMDEHFTNTHDLRQNLPVMMALIGVWYTNFYEYATQVISPYNTRLSKFPAYIQQLEMESNGKSVDRDGKLIKYKTCPVIWGGSGINAQHAYYQLLHQGTSINPMDIILALSDKFSNKNHHNILVANAYAQAEAFMWGKNYAQAKSELLYNGVGVADANFLALHKTFVGNRPTNMLLLPEISPYYLGMLLALYEHQTFVQGVIWQINSFDQMGVELGKQLAKTILNDIESGEISKHDDSSVNLINLYRG